MVIILTRCNGNKGFGLQQGFPSANQANLDLLEDIPDGLGFMHQQVSVLGILLVFNKKLDLTVARSKGLGRDANGCGFVHVRDVYRC